MQKPILLTGMIFSVSVLIGGYRTLTLDGAFVDSFPGESSAYAQQQPTEEANSRLQRHGVSETSCANPTPQQQSECIEMETRILASTVRLVLQRWVKSDAGDYTFEGGSVGLATIKDARYLITHNHHSLTISENEDEALIKVFISPILDKRTWSEVRLDNIAVVIEEEETLVLEFKGIENEALFASPELEFKSLESLPLQSGMEVAQVDWNGETAQVDWIVIDEIITTNGTPRLKLNNFVEPGSSGGGVFWNKYHIANSWSQVTAYDESGKNTLHRYSVAALNSSQVSSFLY